MNHDSAVATPQSPAVGAARSHRDIERDVSEVRGEFRAFKWAATLAFVAIVGTMGFFYSALETLNEGQKDIRQTLGAIYNQTKVLGEHLGRQDERVHQLETGLVEVNARVDQVNVRVDQVIARLDQVDARLDQMDGRIHKVERGLQQVNGRLDRMDGRHEQMDARLGNIEDVLRVLLARSGAPS